MREVQPGVYMDTRTGKLSTTTTRGGWGAATAERANNKYARDMAKKGEANYQTQYGEMQQVTYGGGFSSMYQNDPRANGGFSTAGITAPPSRTTSSTTGNLFGGTTYGAAPERSFWNTTKSRAMDFSGGFFFMDDKRRGVNTLRNIKDTSSPMGYREAGAVAGIIALPATESRQAISGGVKYGFGLYSKGAARAGTAIERTNIGSKLFKARDAAQAFKIKNVQVGRVGVQTAETLGFIYGASSAVSVAAKKTRPEYSIGDTQLNNIYKTAVTESRPGFRFSKPGTYAPALGFELTQLAGDKKKFEASTRSQLRAAGVNNYEADYITRRFMVERRVQGTSEIGLNIFAGSKSEELGRQLVAGRFSRGGTAATKNAFKGGFTRAWPSIAAAGVQEGSAVYIAQQKLRGEKVTPRGVATYGAIGGVTAGTLGGIDVGLSVSAAAKGTRKARFVSNAFDSGLNILDPLEKPGDLVRDYTEGAVSRRTNKPFTSAGTYRASNTITFMAHEGRGLTPSKTRTPSFIKSLIPTASPSTTRTFTPTPTPTRTTPFTFSPTFTPTKTTTRNPVFIPSWTPTITPTFTPTVTPTPTPVPTWTGRGLPILPLAALGGGSGMDRGGRSQSFRYMPSLGAVLFNIKGKKSTAPLSGFEVRPIVSSQRKRGRK